MFDKIKIYDNFLMKNIIDHFFFIEFLFEKSKNGQK